MIEVGRDDRIGVRKLEPRKLLSDFLRSGAKLKMEYDRLQATREPARRIVPSSVTVTRKYALARFLAEHSKAIMNSIGGVPNVAETLIDLEIESLLEGGYLATSADLPGLVAQGRTIAECIEIAQDVARKLVESYIERGDPLPAKLKAKNPDRIGIAIPVGLP